MGRKNDLSNLISKKIDHNNNRRRHNQYQQNANNYNNQTEDSSQQENNNSSSDSPNSINNQRTGSSNRNHRTSNIFGQDNRDYEIDDKANIMIKMPLPMKTVLTALIVAIPLVFLMTFVVLFSDENDTTNGSSVAFGGYYDSRCDEVTVIFVDKNNGYAVTGSQTYSMEDYVAGVVSAEIGGFSNKEVYKVYAIAARTFVERNASEDCSIEGSARKQAFKDITEATGTTVDMIYEAVRETEGEVLLSDGELYAVQYDAFCYVSKDSQYYTLSQQNQKIPVEWAESHVWSKYYLNCPCDLKDESMTECWNSKGVWQDGGHGRGMSQYGALYLATEKNYTYDQILEYYYGDAGITISSDSFMTSVAGLEIKDTTQATALKEPITTFLSSKGSSLEELNSFVHDSVVENGVGTREGVVTAAVSMINYLYDNFNTKLPYYWGGKVSASSIPSSFGTNVASAATSNGNRYYYKSFDCSGFVSWAIRAGGFNFSNHSTATFNSSFSKDSCDITESTCVGQPGDLINWRTNDAGHVMLIVAVDQENGKYFIAHSGSQGVTMLQRNMHTPEMKQGVTKIIFMDNFYNNQANVNTNY